MRGFTGCLCDIFPIKVTDVALALSSTIQLFVVGLVKTKELDSNIFSPVCSKITLRETGVGMKLP